MAEQRPGILGFLRNLRRRASPTETLGTSGTAVYGGYVQQRESNADLTGRTRYKTFSEILANTSIVAAGVRFFLNLGAKADWKIEPAETDGQRRQAEEIAESVDEILLQGKMETPWFRVVRRAMMSRFYGFSLQEWTAMRRDDGLIGYRDIAPRAQITIERWDCDETGRIQGVVQRSPQTFEEIYLPRQKLVYIVDDTLDDSPEGLGVFRHIADTARRLRRYEQLEAYGYELDLKGVPVGRAPLSQLAQAEKDGLISKAERLAREQPIIDFLENHVKNPKLGLFLDSITYTKQDEGMQPSGTYQYDIDLLQGSSGNQAEVGAAITRMNHEIARLIGTEFMLLGGDGAGSLAMARDKSKMFALLVDAAVDEVVEAFTQDILRPLVIMNGWPEKLTPKLKTEAIQHREVEEITGALEGMARSGAMLEPDDPAIVEVRDLLGLSRPNVIRIAADALGSDEGEENAEDLPDNEPNADQGDVTDGP